MRRDISTSLIAIVVLTVLFGLVYPLATTGVAQLVFPGRADGSQIERDGEVVGSSLIGQDFEGAGRYFQSRPSATGYSGNVTYFNNLGPNNKELSTLFADNLAAYLKRERPYDPGLERGDVPVDAVTTSASGVDPHISEANARIQARRVAEERGLELERVLELVDDEHRRALPRRARRAGRERARAEPGARRRRGVAVSAQGSLFGGAALRRALDLEPRQARPARAGPQPRDVRGRDRRGDHHLRLAQAGLRRGPARRRRRARLVHLRGGPLALAHGGLRQPGRGPGRGSRQGSGRRAARDAHRRPLRACATAPRSRPRSSRAGTWWWSRPASSSPATAP